MPLLKKEADIFPADLLDEVPGSESLSSPQQWWALYTLSRREKQLMRSLVRLRIPFYSPTIERRFRSPNGRVRTSYVSLFSNYVFIYGEPAQRNAALTTNFVSRSFQVNDRMQLSEDLRRIRRLIDIGQPLTPEARLVEGDRVRVRTGAFAGFEGVVLRRDKETRLVVSVNFTRQGASVLLDDCQLESL
jgi:transcription antitermination factor NusG